MLNKSRSRLPTLITSIISIIIVGACAWGVLNRQYVVDLWNSMQYQPTTQVETITQSVGFTETGKFYFYASIPSVDNAADFNVHCEKQEPGSAILGCYSDQKIYIYDVPNGQLAGIKEVTAAHETLHAVWERMSLADRDALALLLEDEFSKLNDSKLKERMAYYERTEPGERANELHSILGTEYSNLSEKLETHYSIYFTERSKIVGLHAQYQSVFIALQEQSEALAIQIKGLKEKIDQQTSEYNSESASLSADVEALKAKSGSVDRTSSSEVNQYNNERQELIQRSDVLEQKRLAINANTEMYNVLVKNYNGIVTSINTLTKSLDSTLAPSVDL